MNENWKNVKMEDILSTPLRKENTMCLTVEWKQLIRKYYIKILFI